MRSSASSVRISSSPSSKSKIWALLAPAEEHLRRSAVDAPGDRDDGGIVERASLLERAVGLQHDAEPLAGPEEFAAVVEGGEEHLVHGRLAARTRDGGLEAIVAVVRDAYGAGERAVGELLHVAPAAS